MARTSKNYRFSYNTVANLQYLHDAFPEQSETAIVEQAISAFVNAIEHANLHARTVKRLSEGAKENSWFKGYDEGMQEALSKTGVPYSELLQAFKRRAGDRSTGL